MVMMMMRGGLKYPLSSRDDDALAFSRANGFCEMGVGSLNLSKFLGYSGL